MASMATTAAPTSASVTIRPSAARETKVSMAAAYEVPDRSASSRKLRSIRGPSTGPGDRLLTFTPAGPTSNASVEVSPITAILEAQYGVRRISGRLPETDARLITSPDPRATMAGRNALQTRKTPRTLVSKTSSQSSTSMSIKEATGPAIPALLITIEISRSANDSAKLGDRRRIGDIADPPVRPLAELGRHGLQRLRTGDR